MSEQPTAGMVIIGEEILGGRTQDTNLARLANFLGPIGIAIREVRVVVDEVEEIAAAVNALRTRYTYVFTTGGIGPTHDDVTADGIARAFGVELKERADALAILEAYYAEGDLNAARRRMARIPGDASLIENPVSAAPGFRLENVFTMAGVPKIVDGMLESIRPQLAGGPPLLSVSIRSNALEAEISEGLEALQNEMPDVRFGSYPFARSGRFGTRLVGRTTDADRLAAAEEKIVALLERLGKEYVREDPDAA
ncbi:competence/damage-inducible protein A [Futiania mangrovi]|uniref:Molybdopterin-binding protein n=1 Tax=Futiania mangrovi TaxID=2959716 RepID=A0A9J6P8U2_9PROT|nr:molybdopterin-binding protein [Futiania mangrovii]MCP1335061.1 molybdopterin-binding protein [Futiania mangrovii]